MMGLLAFPLSGCIDNLDLRPENYIAYMYITYIKFYIPGLRLYTPESVEKFLFLSLITSRIYGYCQILY